MIILSINPQLMGEVSKFAQTVTTACQLYIIPVACLIALCQSIFTGLYSSPDNKLDFTPIFRAVFLAVLLFGYSELVPLLSGALDEFSNLIAAKAKITEYLNNYNEANVENSSWFDFSILKFIAGWFQENGTAMIRLIIMSIRDVLFAFLYISGSIAISLSILGGTFKNLVGKWLQSLITIQFWSLTIALVDHLAKFFLLHFTAVDVTQGSAVNVLSSTDLTGYICTNVVVTLMYLLVPYLTSLYAGGSQAGMFMSKVVTVAATALAPAAKAAVMGSGAAGATGATGASGAAGATGASGASGATGTAYARTGGAGFRMSNKNLQE